MDGDAAAVAMAGNEDCAHKAGADIFQALNDVACFLALARSRTGSGRPGRAANARVSTRGPRPLADIPRTLAVDRVHLVKLLLAKLLKAYPGLAGGPGLRQPRISATPVQKGFTP
ncbi:hypothetical protein OHB53_46440 [Streptomyces sp. NBC_00056]|uniref:hypothetical protein n=1 Tax=Streptomyces sp. NBC_00056 TaxID=2975633 RepID=UPI003250B24D